MSIIDMRCQSLFLLEMKKRLSSGTVVIDTFRVNPEPANIF